MSAKTPLPADTSAKLRNMGILCSFLVVIIHCRPSFAFGTAGWWIREFLENGVTQIAVPFFFATSGFMMARDLQGEQGYGKSLLKRVRTLLIPFVIWNILFWLKHQVGQDVLQLIGNEKVSLAVPTWEQVGIYPTGCPLLSPLWYVRALFVLAAMSPLLAWCVKRFRYYFLAFLFIVYAVICPFWPVPDAGGLEVFARVGIFPVLGLFYFSLGIALHQGLVTAKDFRIHPTASLAIGMGLAGLRAVFVWKGLPCAHYLGFGSVPFTLYGVWGLMSASMWPKWLVSSAFGVYLIHKFILVPLLNVLNPGRSVTIYLGLATITFAISLFAVVLLKRWFPKLSVVLLGGR